jgi:hypothetical protein
MDDEKESKPKYGGANGYMLFLREIRPKLKKEHPDWKVTEIAKEGGKMWNALPDEEKEKYGVQLLKVHDEN